MLRSSLVAVALATLTSTAAADQDKVEKTSALDFELVHHTDGSATLRDSAYELTFPGKVTIAPLSSTFADGSAMAGAQAQLSDNQGGELYVAMIIPVPKGTPYDPATGLNGMRDNMVKAVHGKVVKESRETLSGLEFHHSVAEATNDGTTVTLDVYAAWDEPRRTVVSFIAGGSTTKRAGITAFPKSFVLHKSGKTPK